MKLLVVTQYFWPENFRINDLVADMVERGHEVTVLTGEPNYPSGKFAAGYGWWRVRTQDYKGAKIIRMPIIPRGNGSRLRLVLNYLSFAITGALGAWLRLRGPFDAIFVFEVSPITVGLPAIAASKRFKAPIFFWVLDLWPQSLTAAGGIHSPFVLGAVDRLVRYIYSRCARILVQSRAFVPEIRRQGVPESKITYFPSWGESLFKPLERPDTSVLPPLPQGFKIVFAGNIGESQDFTAILKSAEILRIRGDIHWLIVGDGRMAPRMKEEAAQRGLTQVHFLGQYPLETMPHFYASADALLVPLRAEKIFALTIPGKLQSYLACARPILAMLDGEGARVVTEAEAGFTCPAGDAAGLAARVLELAAMPESARRAMGARGRAYYEANFDRTFLFNLLENLIKDTIGQGSYDRTKPI